MFKQKKLHNHIRIYLNFLHHSKRLMLFSNFLLIYSLETVLILKKVGLIYQNKSSRNKDNLNDKLISKKTSGEYLYYVNMMVQ